MRILFSSSFQRALRRLLRGQPELEALIQDKIRLFQVNPQHPQLGTHKLSGQLKNAWSFSITHELRIVFVRLKDGDVMFVDIGNHDRVY